MGSQERLNPEYKTEEPAKSDKVIDSQEVNEQIMELEDEPLKNTGRRNYGEEQQTDTMENQQEIMIIEPQFDKRTNKTRTPTKYRIGLPDDRDENSDMYTELKKNRTRQRLKNFTIGD